MKRVLSILLALVLFCLAAVVPMPKLAAEDTVTAVQEEAISYTLKNWSGEDAPSGFYDPNGVRGFPFNFTLSDWKEVYSRTGALYSIQLDITAPSNAVEGKVLALDVEESLMGNPTEAQLDKLLNEGAYAAITDGSVPVKIDIAELIVENDGKNVSVVPVRRFMTLLFAWKDAGNNVTVQKLGVVIMHPTYDAIVIKENGEFVKEQITTFARTDARAIIEFCEAEEGQPLPYTTELYNGNMVVNTQLRKSDYEKIYAGVEAAGAPGSYLSVEIAPPAGAASFAITTAGSANESVAAELLNSSFWPLEGRSYVGMGLEYAFVQHQDGRMIIEPGFFEHHILVAWKDAEGNPLNVGTEEDARYVEHLTVIVNPDNYDTITIETAQEPSVMTLYSREDEVLVMPDFMPPALQEEEFPYSYVLENGVLNITTAYTQSDYQKVYDHLPAGEEELYMSVEVTPPENAKYFNVAATGEPSEETALGLMNLDKDSYQKLTEERTTAGRGYSFATLKRYEQTVLITPTQSREHLIVTWLDENKEHINVGTEEEPKYVEHLIINMSSSDDSQLRVTDKSYIDEMSIRFNTGNWEDELFAKAAAYKNGKVNYYVSLSKLEALLEENADVMPELYRNLFTGVLAPEGAVGYAFGEDEQQLGADCLVEVGYRWHLQENNGLWSIGDMINADTWDFAWIMEDGTRIAQKLTVEVTLVSDESWMEVGGWTAVANDKILVNPELDGRNGMSVDKDSDGKGHAYNSFSGKTINEEKIRDVEVTIGLEAPVLTDDSGNTIEITGFKANSSSGANVYVIDERLINENKSYLENSGIMEFDTNIPGFEGKKVVPVGRLATFTTERLKAANDVLMDVYFYETYGISRDNGLFVVIYWLDGNGEVAAKEYFYHTNDGEMASYTSAGVEESEITSAVTEATVLEKNHSLYVETPEQNIVESNEASDGAQYMQITLQDTSGSKVQPDEDGVDVLLPYPDGVTYDSSEEYDFALQHYTDESHTESELVTLTATENGLLFTAESFSPFMLSWSRNVAVNAVTVNGGSGSGNYAEGEEVTIEANEPEEGKRFKEWSGAEELEFVSGDATSAVATFTMPAREVTLTAVYEDIPVEEITLTGIEITNMPDKLSYTEGESFDPAGMVIKATYSDGSEAVIDAAMYTFAPNGALSTADTAITITCEGATAQVAITVKRASQGGNGSSGSGGNVYYPVVDTEEDEKEDAQDCWQVVCRKLNVRTGAGTRYARIGTLTRGEHIRGEMLDNGWVKFVQDDGTCAYVCGAYLEQCDVCTEEDGEETATVVCRKLNVRSGAGTKFKRVGQLSRGETVRIAERSNGWCRIVYGEGFAWVHGKYVG